MSCGQADTALFDRRAREFLAFAHARDRAFTPEIHVPRNFAREPNFTNDGILIIRDRPLVKFFALSSLHFDFHVGRFAYDRFCNKLSDHLSQYATLKAVRLALERASSYALVIFLPASVLGVCFSYILAEIPPLSFNMTFGSSIGTLALTIGMCVLSGVSAVRRVLWPTLRKCSDG